MMVEAASNGNNVEIFIVLVLSVLSLFVIFLGVFVCLIEVFRYVYVFFLFVINASTSGSTKRNYNRNIALKIFVGGNVFKINSVLFGLYMWNIFFNVFGMLEKFLSV